MPRSPSISRLPTRTVDHDTRRTFLLRLARASLFVPPLLITHDLYAQGQGQLSPTNGKGKGKTGSTASLQAAPWAQHTQPAKVGPTAPWKVPPGS